MSMGGWMGKQNTVDSDYHSVMKSSEDQHASGEGPHQQAE